MGPFGELMLLEVESTAVDSEVVDPCERVDAGGMR